MAKRKIHEIVVVQKHFIFKKKKKHLLLARVRTNINISLHSQLLILVDPGSIISGDQPYCIT